MSIWPWSKIKRLEKEIDGLIEDASEMIFQRLLIENGNMEATIENKLLTKMLAEWARQIFEQYPEAVNYMSMQFTFHGVEMYELMIQRVLKKTPAQVNMDLKERIKELEAALQEGE